MKIKTLCILIALGLILAGCGQAEPDEKTTVDLQSTLVALQVVQTMAAQNMESTLTAVANIPTATCPPTCMSPTATTVPAATASATELSPTPIKLGSISGNLSYPSEYIPALYVVAFNLTLDEFFYIQTDINTSFYTISNLPAGTYHVLAYPRTVSSNTPVSDNFFAGYSQAVLCGLNTTCTDHALVDVKLAEGESKFGIDPGDWYMDNSIAIGWPANPITQ
ncbi:MAG: hypothetical protein WA116_10705 [Anaerolineaceae bacterium]